MNTKTEVFPESTETPFQRRLRKALSAFYALVAVAVATLTILGFFTPKIGT